MQIKIYSKTTLPSPGKRAEIVSFLHHHLGRFGDREEDITKAIDYSLSQHDSAGGFVITAEDEEKMTGATVVNKTGMEGYIPENILVYIATHESMRGQGLGKKLMQTAIDTAEGNIALHVEHDNPALHLYKKLGFTNKYLEMRLDKKEVEHGISNA